MESLETKQYQQLTEWILAIDLKDSIFLKRIQEKERKNQTPIFKISYYDPEPQIFLIPLD